MNIEKRSFGYSGGKAVSLYTLTADNGISVSITDFGGAIVKIMTPDREGNMADIVCGYDSLSSYEGGDGYQGALIGRFGNRIANGRFTLEGKEYILYQNNGENHLHGGRVGFSHKIWDATPSMDDNYCSLTLKYTSPDGEEGYPGELRVTVKYTLDNEGALTLNYSAVTDKKTVVSLTNHTYFNLGGYDSGKIFDHELYLDCDRSVEIREGLIPTGNIVSVEGTPFDFRNNKTIGCDFDLAYEQLALAKGYDHCLVFTEREEPMNAPRAVAYDKKSGRVLELYTDAPAVHFYTANFMKNPNYPLKNGYPQGAQNAFCLETEKMPDSMNHEGFTDCTLDVGEVYSTVTVFKFSVK